MGMIPAARRGYRWLVEQPSAYDFGLALFTAVVGLSSAAQQYGQGRPGMALVLAGATTAALGLGVTKSIVSLANARRKESPHDLEGCLHTLHSILLPEWEETEGTLRLAIHVPVAGDALLEQVTEYIGDAPKPGRIGRRFPVNAGIIGRAFRENESFVAERVNDSYEHFVQELVTIWNYTEHQAKWVNPAVMAWMAVPFYDGIRRRVDGVLFLDSTSRSFFTEGRQELVLRAASGIAVFIGKRYA